MSSKEGDMKKPSLHAICMHEAGHAIVQLATGPAPWIDYIEVNNPDPDKLAIVYSRAMWQPHMRGVAAPPIVVEQWRRLAARDIVNYLAGPVAELRWNRCSRLTIQLAATDMAARCVRQADPEVRDDAGLVLKRLAWLMPGAEEAGFVEAWLATEEIVAAWWSEIVELGRNLLDRGRIEAVDLQEIWEGMRNRRGEQALQRAIGTADWLGRFPLISGEVPERKVA